MARSINGYPLKLPEFVDIKTAELVDYFVRMTNSDEIFLLNCLNIIFKKVTIKIDNFKGEYDIIDKGKVAIADNNYEISLIEKTMGAYIVKHEIEENELNKEPHVGCGEKIFDLINTYLGLEEKTSIYEIFRRLKLKIDDNKRFILNKRNGGILYSYIPDKFTKKYDYIFENMSNRPYPEQYNYKLEHIYWYKNELGQAI